jgi:hypothetical protein
MRWRDRPEELDDEPKPKDSTCLAARHNRELAEQAYPARRVYDVGTSFQSTVHALRDCGALRRAVAALPP